MMHVMPCIARMCLRTSKWRRMYHDNRSGNSKLSTSNREEFRGFFTRGSVSAATTRNNVQQAAEWRKLEEIRNFPRELVVQAATSRMPIKTRSKVIKGRS